MKKNIKFWFLFLFVIGTAVISMGCSSGSKSVSSSSGSKSASGSSAYDSVTSEEVAESANGIISDVYDSEVEDVTKNRKIIERLYFSLQTREFDELIEKIEAKAAEAGGYIETSSIDGKELEYDNHRHAELVIRIPSEKSDAFSTYISENSTVISKEVETEDVTLTYVDIESRISALNTEKSSLENLLADAQTISDIITIQDRLTEVIYEMESYQSQLRTYDNLIDYTTITVSVSEVERTQIVEKQTIWEEIGTNLSNNVRIIGNFFVRLFVVLTSSLPFLVILVIVVVVIIVLVKRSDKKTMKKAAAKSQQAAYVPYGNIPNNNQASPSAQLQHPKNKENDNE